MSIAVSADIRPSRLLFFLMAVASLAVASIGVIFALAGQSSFILRVPFAAVCVFAALLAFWRILRNRKTICLHISGSGQIRLAEHHVLANKEAQVFNGALAQLLANSTIWPNLLFLRLKLDEGGIRTIFILPDSVSKETFRALQVACRWVVNHDSAVNKQ